MNVSRPGQRRRKILLALVCLTVSGTLWAQTQQQHVHQMAHTVMPFDMARTLHIFRMTTTGGVEQVIVRDPADNKQIALIRQHLSHEARRFQQGNYRDPATLHGDHMPGLQALQAGASDIQIGYSDLPNGGQITFTTTDLTLLTAIHRWFGAQLSEHGADARAE
ncbi:MAG: hypothetical protein R3292_00740 [Alcanivorax sp.]|nr:hypothetical protein [Alcanivorax sp.]